MQIHLALRSSILITVPYSQQPFTYSFIKRNSLYTLVDLLFLCNRCLAQHGISYINNPPPFPQTDSVNLESILNDIETISEDILAIQLEKSKSRDNLMSQAEQGNSSNCSDKDNSKKPYRSEMNLYLQYDGVNPTISNGTATTQTGSTVIAASSASDSSSGHKLSSRTRSLEREPTDSPAPHMPDPMAPFPDKCTYLGFEQLNQQAAGMQSPASGQKPPVGVKPNIPAKPPPPLPPARRPAMPTEPPPSPPVGVSPNKSHLYKSLATAAAKRAIFRSTPTQLTRSLDVEWGAGPGDATDPVEASEVGFNSYMPMHYILNQFVFHFGRMTTRPSARHDVFQLCVRRNSSSSSSSQWRVLFLPWCPLGPQQLSVAGT